MRMRYWCLVLAGLWAAMGLGCGLCRKDRSCAPSALPPRAGSRPLILPPQAGPGGPIAPAAPGAQPPPGSIPILPTPQGGVPAGPSVNLPGVSNYEPCPPLEVPAWRPAEPMRPRAEAPPAPRSGAPRSSEATLLPPVGVDEPKAREPAAEVAPPRRDPLPRAEPAPRAEPEEKPAPAAFPVGIAQFNGVRDRVSAGLKPDLEGLQWLKDRGYRTVLHILPPGAEDTDRQLVELRGLSYVPLRVSAQTLTRELLQQFNQLVADAASQPIFVYDRDGSVAGALWYLHFRTAEKLDDEKAAQRAAPLGLKSDKDGEHKALWVAIQQVLSTLGQ